MVPTLIFAALVVLLYRIAMQTIAAISFAGISRDRAMTAFASSYGTSIIYAWVQTHALVVDFRPPLLGADRRDPPPQNTPKVHLKPIKPCKNSVAKHFLRLTG